MSETVEPERTRWAQGHTFLQAFHGDSPQDTVRSAYAASAGAGDGASRRGDVTPRTR